MMIKFEQQNSKVKNREMMQFHKMMLNRMLNRLKN